MSENKRKVTPPDPGFDSSIACDEARRLLPRHAKSELNESEQALFRQHILACSECRDAYRTAISMTAKVGHALSQNRIERARRERRLAARALPFKVGQFGRTRKAYWMRAMIGTALLILLVTRIPGWMIAPTLEASWEQGAVKAATRELSQGDAQADLSIGDWLVTSPNGSAKLEGFGGLVEVGSGSSLLVEDPKTCRLRFQRGSIVAEGRTLILTQYGFAQLDGGRASFVTSQEGLEIRVLEGVLDWTHPRGVEHLGEGDQGLVQVPGPLLAGR